MSSWRYDFFRILYAKRCGLIIQQASPEDSIWGVGFSAKNAEENRDKWGENLLGLAIMKVREKLRKENR